MNKLLSTLALSVALTASLSFSQKNNNSTYHKMQDENFAKELQKALKENEECEKNEQCKKNLRKRREEIQDNCRAFCKDGVVTFHNKMGKEVLCSADVGNPQHKHYKQNKKVFDTCGK